MSHCTAQIDRAGQCRLDALAGKAGVITHGLCDQIPALVRQAYAAMQSGRMVLVQDLMTTEDWLEAVCGVEQNAHCPVSKYLLAKLYSATGQRDAAEAQFLSCLALEVHPALLHDLARFYGADARRLSEAVQYSQRAHALAPDDAWIHCTYAHDLIHAGRVDAGFAHMCQAAQQAPDDPFLQTNRLWHEHYVPEQDRSSFFQAYADWGRRFAPTHLCCYDYVNRPEPERRLRIGYISPNFCRHSVAYTFEPILDGHDRSQVEVYGYGNVACPDETTDRLQAKFDRYRQIHAQPPETVADQVRSDCIDILVNLGGHCTGNGLLVMAYRPAPIQADFGGLSTTGLEQVDYTITDDILDPPETQAFYVETLVHLPGSSLVYCPPVESPLVASPPALTNGFVTFGSFNNHIKINAYTLYLWCQVLNSVPDSRMVLKFQAGHDPGLQSFYRHCFARHGIAPDRIDIVGATSHFDHLRQLGQVDLALDTFPFNGCVTTLEGLWMGVPILSLSGATCVSCIGRDIMTHLALDVFVADSPNEFVAKACAFTGQLESLAAIRGALRGLMLDSPLCSPGRLACALESVYRCMWHRWCHDVAGVSG